MNINDKKNENKDENINLDIKTKTKSVNKVKSVHKKKIKNKKKNKIEIKNKSVHKKKIKIENKKKSFNKIKNVNKTNSINKTKSNNKTNSNNKKKTEKIIICNNCGKKGHVYKKCNSPIMSSGIICYKLFQNDIKFLMIRRKDTYSFVEFIRGYYSLNNIGYLKKMFQNMTINEVIKIQTRSFDSLWSDFWCISNKRLNRITNVSPRRSHNMTNYNFNTFDDFENNQIDELKIKPSHVRVEFIKAKEKFNELKRLNILDTIIRDYPPKWKHQEWGFPKGRRNIRENDRDCAIREFKEETGLLEDDIILQNYLKPFIEIYNGSNNLKYMHKYFVAQAQDNYNTQYLNKSKQSQKIEISCIKWLSYEEALDKIRPYHYKKAEILTRVYTVLKNNIITKLGR